MDLSSYLKMTKQTRADFAALVGAHPVTVSRWSTSAAIPKRKQMARIEEVTDGQVTAGDMMDRAMLAARPSGGGAVHAPKHRGAA